MVIHLTDHFEPNAGDAKDRITLIERPFKKAAGATHASPPPVSWAPHRRRESGSGRLMVTLPRRISAIGRT